MYEKCDQIPKLIRSAEDFCLVNDRELYAPFLRAAEDWCSRKECAVGGVSVWVKARPSTDSFVMEIYAAYALSAARDIADALVGVHAPHIDTRTVGVQTIVKNMEFAIKVMERVVVRVWSLPAWGGVNMIQLLGCVQKTGFFSGVMIPCLPQEIHLCALYRVLYSPSRFGEWEAAAASLGVFWEGITREGLEEKNKTGGKGGSSTDWKPLYKAIANVCDGEAAPIVIGDFACKRLTGVTGMRRLQIITAGDIDRVCEGVRVVHGKVVAIKYLLNLPMDFQTTKHTIYAKVGERKVPLCDVYNSTEFELVPYEMVGGVRYAAPFVLMRFKLIDYWIHRAVARVSAGLSAASIVESAWALREWMIANDAKLYDSWKYLGYSISPAVAKKKLAAELSDTMFPVYYPAKKLE